MLRYVYACQSCWASLERTRVDTAAYHSWDIFWPEFARREENLQQSCDVSYSDNTGATFDARNIMLWGQVWDWELDSGRIIPHCTACILYHTDPEKRCSWVSIITLTILGRYDPKLSSDNFARTRQHCLTSP